MAWTEPKTDWTAGTNTQEYNGDRFTYVDFNRIKNNVLYLYELAVDVYPITAAIEQYISNSEAYHQGGSYNPNMYHYFYLWDGAADREVTDFVYADEVNYFEERIHFLADTMGITPPGALKYFNDNGYFIDAEELNNLENMCLTMQPLLYNMFISRRRLPIRLTQKQNHIDL